MRYGILSLLLALVACGGGGGGEASGGVSSANSSNSSARSSASQASSKAGSAGSSSASSVVRSSSSASSQSSSQSSNASASQNSSQSSSAQSSPVSGLAAMGKGFTAFYADPNSQARQWVAANPGDSRAATINSAIAQQAAGKWFGEWSGDIGSAVGNYVSAAQGAGKIPLLIAYNIPNRDCGAYSAGGASGGDAYKAWISAYAAAIGARPAIVILEPDGLMQLDCLRSDADRTARLALFNYAVDQFAAKAPGAWLYLDAGHSNWKSPADTARRLISAGVARARGFALNVSNYRSDSELQGHGSSVIDQLQAQGSVTKPYVIDSSRNGNGPKDSEWCDPAGRKVGAPSQVLNPGAGQEMTLWLKAPGESDGCAGAAGSFVPDLAYRLALGS
ncbi:MAG TPA: glycoside hydrolase family 6 protein [Rhodocyclaceae bacterium]|nr:glycoside hydrolase family 6 protein [Rhodocyclaceae bacterium]